MALSDSFIYIYGTPWPAWWKRSEQIIIRVSAGLTLYESLNLWIYIWKYSPLSCLARYTVAPAALQWWAKWEPHRESKVMNNHAVGLLQSLFMLLFRKNLKDFPVFFLYVKKITARSRSQHGDKYPGLPGKVLLCSWSFHTAYLTAATQFCQHSAASWLAHSMNLIYCQCIMQRGFCLYIQTHVWHRAPWSCAHYNLCFDLFPSLALIRLRDFCWRLAVYAK